MCWFRTSTGTKVIICSRLALQFVESWHLGLRSLFGFGIFQIWSLWFSSACTSLFNSLFMCHESAKHESKPLFSTVYFPENTVTIGYKWLQYSRAGSKLKLAIWNKCYPAFCTFSSVEYVSIIPFRVRPHSQAFYSLWGARLQLYHYLLFSRP